MKAKKPPARRKMSDAEKVLRAEFRVCLRELHDLAKEIRESIRCSSSMLGSTQASDVIATHIEQLAREKAEQAVPRTYTCGTRLDPYSRLVVGRGSDYAAALENSAQMHKTNGGGQ